MDAVLHIRNRDGNPHMMEMIFLQKLNDIRIRKILLVHINAQGHIFLKHTRLDHIIKVPAQPLIILLPDILRTVTVYQNPNLRMTDDVPVLIQQNTVGIHHDSLHPVVLNKPAQIFFKLRMYRRLSANETHRTVTAVTHDEIHRPVKILFRDLIGIFIYKFIGKAVRTSQIADVRHHNISHLLLFSFSI